MRWLLTILFLGIIVMGARAEYLGNLSIDGVDYNITASGGNSVLLGNISIGGTDWNVSVMGGIDSSVLGNSDTIVYFGFLDNSAEEEGVPVVDTIPPALTVFEPQNINYSYPNVSIDFEVSLDFSDCWYVLNEAPLVNISCITNTTFNATIGENNISINVNDTSNNINTTNITFEMYNETPIITFDSNTSTTTTISINFNTSVVANTSIDLSNNNDYPDVNNFNLTHYNTITGLTTSTVYSYNITTCTKTSLCSRLENLSVTTLAVSEEEEVSAPSVSGGGGVNIGWINYTNIHFINLSRTSDLVLINESSIFVIEIINGTGNFSNISIETFFVEGITQNISIPVFMNQSSEGIYFFVFNASIIGDYVFVARFSDDYNNFYEVKKSFLAADSKYGSFRQWVGVLKEFVIDNKEASVVVSAVLLLVLGLLFFGKGFGGVLQSKI